MNGTVYQQRLQKAYDYIENHLESTISLDDLAVEASYSPGYFVWIFRTVTGYTPMEYVRRRRMTEAARAILACGDIVDIVYRFGFSAQDAFTRSFRNSIGLTPGQVREFSGENGNYTPAVSLPQKGGRKMLNYNLDCDTLESFLRVEHLLNDEVKELVGQIVIKPADLRTIDPHICDELRQARIVCLDGDMVRIDTSVFLEEELLRIYSVAGKWGGELAQRVMALGNKLPEMLPGVKRLLVGMNGLDQGVFELLISSGYTFDHRSTGGRYAGAKIDFYEVCDAYYRFGPYLSSGYGFSGERYAVKIIGRDRGIYDYLNAGIDLKNNELYTFRTNINRYLTDALGGILRGEITSPSLSEAAEASGLTRSGKTLVPFITTPEAPAYSGAVILVREVVKEFLHSKSAEMQSFLKGTLTGKQGVSPDKQMVDLMRYVRMVTHKALYEASFYTDSLPDGGNITIFREVSARIDGKYA
jgi:AraC-like DNA-binding protein